MELRTHERIDRRLCGEPVEVSSGFAAVELVARPDMAVDDRGLVHGGFVFGMADHAAMLAVNEPHVVLASSSCRFLKPVRVGERLVARAQEAQHEGRRRVVLVEVLRDGEPVLSGELVCYALDRHVFERGEEGER